MTICILYGYIMTTRGRPPKATLTSLHPDAIMVKLDSIEKILEQNTKDIADLKHQVSMGKGGIRAIFIIGAIVAAIATAIGLLRGQ